MLRIIWFALLLFVTSVEAEVTVGIDRLFTSQNQKLLKGKRVALLTNHTAVNKDLQSSIDLFRKNAERFGYTLSALFGPEHGIDGSGHAEEKIKHRRDHNGIPIYSLHGTTRRPTESMLKAIDTVVVDIQDIGSRSYTYISTLFYLMEECAKRNISVIVCDRPNPINGLTIDGPMLDSEWRSFVSYINVPYLHGMTIGELAHYFNKEYKVGCKLSVITMKGWKRSMTFKDTGLTWIPTSPQIPEADSPLFYPATGILGELQMVSIGIGYTLPFKVVGAPYIDKKLFAQHLNAQKFPGVRFQPFSFKPFFGRFEHEICNGVLIVVTDSIAFRPVSTQYLILGILKSLYPSEFQKGLAAAARRRAMFCKVNGTKEVLSILEKKRYVVWPLRTLHEKRREAFRKTRKKYLMKSYS